MPNKISTKKYPQRNSHKKNYRMDLEKHLPKRLWWKRITKHLWRKIATKNIRKIYTKESLKRHSLPKGWKRNLYQKYLNTFLPKSLGRRLLDQNLSEEKSMPTNFSKRIQDHFKPNLFDDDMYLTKNSMAVFKDCFQTLPKVLLKWWLSLKTVIKDCPKFCWSDGCL